MSSISTIGDAAVQLLRESVLRAHSFGSTSLISRGATAAKAHETGPFKGSSVSDSSVLDPTASAAKAKITDALFSASPTDLTQVKLTLLEKTGEALGVLQEDFASDSEYLSAVKDAFSQLKLQDNAAELIDAIENKLGLNELGVTLQTVVGAMTNPGGDEDKALNAALVKGLKSINSIEPGDNNLKPRQDELGIYSLTP